MHRRWFRLGFYAPFGFWARGFHGPWFGAWHHRRAWPFPRIREYRQWLEDYRRDLQEMRQELDEELKEVEAELERLRGAQQEEERQGP
ncbi:hypothetical protein HRbin24_02164 [bacterium HR24]|jgi:hypothetical protein|nr:hypothetical protein HRbin24_02164 [bacterium HR24]